MTIKTMFICIIFALLFLSVSISFGESIRAVAVSGGKEHSIITDANGNVYGNLGIFIDKKGR